MDQTQFPVIILVIGVVGAGKSTFVRRATRNTNVEIGHGMHSSTQHPTLYPFLLDNKEVCLIDTPGFDDDTRTDAAILEELSSFLSQLAKWNRNPTGILYLQDITSNRVTGSEKFRTRLCEDICGAHGLRNLVIATTRWEQIAHTPSVGFERLRQRREDEAFWKFMLDNGAQVVTHHDTEDSALNIVRMFLPKQPVQFQLVDELISHDGQVAKTSAGKRVCGKLEMQQSEKAVELVKLTENYQQTVVVQQELRDLGKEEAEFRKKKVSVRREIWEHVPGWLQVGLSGLGIVTTIATAAVAAPTGCTMM